MKAVLRIIRVGHDLSYVSFPVSLAEATFVNTLNGGYKLSDGAGQIIVIGIFADQELQDSFCEDARMVVKEIDSLQSFITKAKGVAPYGYRKN